MFSETKSRETSGLEGKQIQFPEGSYIKCIVICLDFHFNLLQQQQKNTFKGSESKQSTRYL